MKKAHIKGFSLEGEFVAMELNISQLSPFCWIVSTHHKKLQEMPEEQKTENNIQI